MAGFTLIVRRRRNSRVRRRAARARPSAPTAPSSAGTPCPRLAAAADTRCRLRSYSTSNVLDFVFFFYSLFFRKLERYLSASTLKYGVLAVPGTPRIGSSHAKIRFYFVVLELINDVRQVSLVKSHANTTPI